MNDKNDIIRSGNIANCEKFLEIISNKTPMVVIVIGNTETGKIPGISAAGANPEITDFTPAADIEYLYYNYCKTIDGVPVTPTGIPTPAVITKAVLDLTNMPLMALIGGVNILPQTPYISVGGIGGGDISKGNSVSDAEVVFENAKLFGENLAKSIEYLVIGESIAGGTTTAMGVLTALGYNAWTKVSSSLPENPLDLKQKIVKDGLKKNIILEENPISNALEAVSKMGDPMQAAALGLIAGSAPKVPILLAGGTQMAAIAALVKALDPKLLQNIAIGTTRWIIEDKGSDIQSLVNDIDSNLPILAANLNFSSMQSPGLQVYEQGIVKEGVGAGGCTIAALVSENNISLEQIHQKIEQNYEKLVQK
jgi:uncharacterized protein (TIGR00303 family)